LNIVRAKRPGANSPYSTWAAAIGIEKFFKGVQERASDLSEEQRKAVLGPRGLLFGFNFT
jgi:hypothetical protein